MIKQTPLDQRCPEQLLDRVEKKYVCRRTGLPCEYLIISNCRDYQAIRYNHQLTHKHGWFRRG